MDFGQFLLLQRYTIPFYIYTLLELGQHATTQLKPTMHQNAFFAHNHLVHQDVVLLVSATATRRSQKINLIFRRPVEDRWTSSPSDSCCFATNHPSWHPSSPSKKLPEMCKLGCFWAPEYIMYLYLLTRCKQAAGSVSPKNPAGHKLAASGRTRDFL